MSNKSKLLLACFFLVFLLAGNAHAIPFTGDAWIAEHYELGEATGDYYLIIDEPNAMNVKVHGFQFLAEGTELDFSGLTGQANDGISWLQIDPASVGLDLGYSSYPLYFSADGTWYQGSVGFASFENPVAEAIEIPINDGPYVPPAEDGGQTTASVPEPSTLLILGASLFGLGLVRKHYR